MAKDEVANRHLSLDVLQKDKDFFWEHGYIILRDVFTPEEMQHLKAAILNNDKMNMHIDRVRESAPDGKHGAFSTIFVWYDTGGYDIFAKATRNYKILERMKFFFDDDVYVHHNKVALKYPGVRGFQHHQDYAYWYDMGLLYPDMVTVQIAIDDATIENGCLRFIDGSHKLGRVEHAFDEDVKDTGVEKKRLALVAERLPEVVAEMKSGDAVLFHGNTFHGSHDNNSNKSRLALLGCCNVKSNVQVRGNWNIHPYERQPSITSPITAEDIDNLPDFNLRFT